MKEEEIKGIFKMLGLSSEDERQRILYPGRIDYIEYIEIEEDEEYYYGISGGTYEKDELDARK